MARRTARVCLGGLLILGLPGVAAAQGGGAASTHLLDRGDIVIAVSLLAAQGALFAFDDELHEVAARSRSRATDAVAGALRPLGRKPPWYYASIATYAIGKVVGEVRVADVGLHAFVTLAIANTITGGLKGLTGRYRPVVLDVQGTDSVWVAHHPDQWDLLAGWRDGGPRQSWPSGHTTAAFAVAAVLSEELGGAVPWIAYPVAAGVAWSRVNDEAHWATDVMMGALVGTLTARLVVRHGHGPGGWLERTLLIEQDPYTGGIRIGVRVR